MIFVLALAVVKNIPRFLQFRLEKVDNKTDYWPSPLMENTGYIRFSSYWDELLISGLVPLASLVFFNARIYLKVSKLVCLDVTEMVLDLIWATDFFGPEEI